MSKGDYFKELAYRLRGLPERERQNILSVYEELFQKAVENGKLEEEIAESLGYPRVPNWDAAREPQPPSAPPQSAPRFDKATAPKTDPRVDPYSNPKFDPHYNAQYNPYAEPGSHDLRPYPSKTESGFKAIISSIALGFFNLIFVLGPFAGLCGVIIALYAVSAALLITPVLAVIGSITSNSMDDMLLLGAAMLALFGVGLLFSLFTVWFSKLFIKLTGKYIRFNIKIIKGA
ncbi:HAAS signaling domain-containing protein [Paenibacillus eucommiae]|uniref:Membrane protein n=1 Tax=Paenibacillus eucommiae TaxID=1355755 RepID=A0ABS4IYR9_9BACL|nr:DUF1700 domain-containing protein [Paenibacillus eucommiae]MBP1992668.1 putative membrane protein [Paenibacillus eucommiae]